MADASFYVRNSPDEVTATPSTAGPWDPKLQHGGPPAALLGMAMEALAPRAGTRVAHFTLDFLGPVPVAPMRVTTETLRPGKKIELLGATALVGGRSVLRATAWRLSTEEGRAPAIHVSDPPPPFPAVAEKRLFPGAPVFGYGLALEWRFTEGGFHLWGPATAWTRLRIGIVEGEPVTPLARVLAMVDSANGISAEIDPSLFLFVPVTLTVSLAREPSGEWVGMSAKTRIATAGVGTTHADLFDEKGYLGESLQTLFVEPRPTATIAPTK